MMGMILHKHVSPTIIKEIRRSIKSFLSFANKFDGHYNNTSLKGSKKRPIWLTKYNYQSLLNIPRQMKLYGPMINLLEDSLQGEGYLRYVKPKYIASKPKLAFECS